MTVGLYAGERPYEIGSASFFKSFFSTIFVRVENENWGSEFPVLMNDLYQGVVSSGDCSEALSEVHALRRELAKLPPSVVVWDFENRTAQPPWGDQISPQITSLANYFVTSDGQDLLTVIEEAFIHAERANQPVVVG